MIAKKVKMNPNINFIPRLWVEKSTNKYKRIELLAKEGDDVFVTFTDKTTVPLSDLRTLYHEIETIPLDVLTNQEIYGYE